ncbi:MAG: hypothetical protein SGJ21_11285 [Alphaproteobacteria bacterium]|nr:hypothetical protein [Alphaproteobacteria bacterium]
MVRRGRPSGRWRWLTRAFEPRGLSGFALLGFFFLSVMATGLGFADLRAANTDAERLSGPELALTGATTLFVVSAMVVALHHVVADRRLWVKALSFVFYIFFALWSVGFGYGFFWKELAGQEFTERQFESVVSRIAGSMARASLALETAETATVGAAGLAGERARTEASQGRTCANRPVSTPGEGPLMRSRFSFADRAANLGLEVRQRWIAPVADQRARLEQRVTALVKRTVPAAGATIDEAELGVLEKLAGAARLPASERRALFVSVHEDARAFAEASNGLRALNATAFADRLTQLAAEVGADPRRPGSPDPARASDPGYCWDVVLHEKLLAAAGQVRAIEDVETPEFEFLEGPKATRAAFFGLVGWMAGWFGVTPDKETSFTFGEKEFLALFASLAVDLGIVFLTIIRDAPARAERPARSAKGQGGSPTPPRLASILGEAPARSRKRKRSARPED